MNHKQLAELEYIEESALAMGWEILFADKHRMSDEEVEQEKARFKQQQNLYWVLSSYFEAGFPDWGKEELTFPLEESWVEYIKGAVDFDLTWRIQWEKEKLGVHPRYHKDLPELPKHITTADVAGLLSTLKKVRDRWGNKIASMFASFSIDSIIYESAFSAQMQKYEREKSKRKSRERAYIEAEKKYRKNKLKLFNLWFELREDERQHLLGMLKIDPRKNRSIEETQSHLYPKVEFYISKYLCTQRLYEFVMGVNPSRFKGEQLPVERVSWCEAVLFCNKLSQREDLTPYYKIPKELEKFFQKGTTFDADAINELSLGIKPNHDANGYRLPTELEWEYCAKAEEEYVYSGSNSVDEVAWCRENSDTQTHNVAQKKENSFGLYDMSGNVWEWCWDLAEQETASTSDHKINVQRVYRGGSWYYGAKNIQLSCRAKGHAATRTNDLGFRIVRECR